MPQLFPQDKVPVSKGELLVGDSDESPTRLLAGAPGTYLRVAADGMLEWAPVSAVDPAVEAHISRTDNPHAVTAAQVGAPTTTDLSSHTSRTDNPHTVTKAQVGLGFADNTADVDKPVSGPQQTALDGKSDTTHSHTQLHSHANKATLDAVTAAFLTADRTKLDGVQAGAEVNVNTDWNATAGDALLLNKPATFPPSAHNHAGEDINSGLVSAVHLPSERIPPSPVAGRYYSPSQFFLGTRGPTSITTTANRTYGIPFIPPYTVTPDRMAIFFETTAAGDALLGIYDANSFGFARNLLASTATFSTGFAGTSIISISGVTLIKGEMYYLAVVTSGTPTIRGFIPLFMFSQTGSAMTSNVFPALYTDSSTFTLTNPSATFTTQTPDIQIRV